MTEEQLLAKYDGVIHMQTAAKASKDLYQLENNEARFETVEEAMDIAKKNHKKMKNKPEYKKGPVEKEVPVWFNQNIEANSASEEERQAIEDMLKEYR